MLSVQLARGNALKLTLRAHILTTFCQPFLHYESALLPSLNGSIPRSLGLRLILRCLTLTGRHRNTLVLPDGGQCTLAIGFPVIDHLIVRWPRRVARPVLV
jgi:hypothetical protein